jgi:hypothetical protein
MQETFIRDLAWCVAGETQIDHENCSQIPKKIRHDHFFLKILHCNQSFIRVYSARHFPLTVPGDTRERSRFAGTNPPDDPRVATQLYSISILDV